MGEDEKKVTKKASNKKGNATKKENEVKENKTTKKTTKNTTKNAAKNTTKTPAKSTAKNATSNKSTKSSVKNASKKGEVSKKVEVKKEEKQEKEAVKLNAQPTKKKVTAVSSDKVVISIIVGVCVLIALSVFGFVFYKSNYESVVSTDFGNVTKAEYTVYYKMFAPMLEYYGYTASNLPRVIANKAGSDKVLLSKAREAGVKLTDEEKAEIEETFSDEEQIKVWKESEINVEILKRLFEEDYMISAYIQKVADEAKDEDMIKYLKDTYGETADLYEYNTRHILIKTTKTNDSGSSESMSESEKAAALQKAQSILQRVKDGEDFATLAKELSEDTGTATKGGEFSFYDGDYIMEEYEEAAKSLGDGQIYDGIVETSAGYHIIKLDSKTENGRVKSDTERTYYANNFINEIAAASRIEVNTDVLSKVIESITGTKPVLDEEDNDTSDVSTDAEEVTQE